MTRPSTLDLAEAAATAWDVVVVGAGPAGALAARELAQRTQAVLLVDREPFPRWKVCGCCLNGRALTTLAQVGLADLPRDCGAVALRQVQLGTRGRGAVVALPAGAALSRQALDTALVEAAVRVGAAFLPGVSARLDGHGAQGRGVALQEGERRATVTARIVVLAHGLGGNLLADEPGFRLDTGRAARVGAGIILETAPAFYKPGSIFMACGRGGYVGLVRLEDGRLDVAAACDAVWLRQSGRPGRAAAALLAETGWPTLEGLDGPGWRGTPRLTRRLRPVAGERLFVLGDAAGYVEPFTGEGMAWALAAAVALTPVAERAVRGWRNGLVGEWCRRYRKTVVRRQLPCRLTAAALRQPWLMQAVLTLLGHAPGVAAPLLRSLNAV